MAYDSNNELRSLWETGVPLDNAWLEFTEGFLDKFAFKMLRTHPSNDVAVAGDPRFKQLEGWLPPSPEGREKKFQITRDVERSHLLDALYEDRLWAVGFVTKPDGFDEPRRVPREFFFVDYDGERPDQMQINWSKGELIGRGVSYFDIRVIRPPIQGGANDGVTIEQTVQTESREASPRKSRTGRPSTKAAILAEVERLADDPDFLEFPNRTAQAREVRANLIGEDARFQDDRIGYNTDVIKRIIGQVITRRSV